MWELNYSVPVILELLGIICGNIIPLARIVKQYENNADFIENVFESFGSYQQY